MEIEETMLENKQEPTDAGIDTDIEEAVEDLSPDEEFEYDDEGNIIIPDLIDDEESEEELPEETEDEEATSEAEDEAEEADPDAEPTAQPAAPETEPEAKSQELSRIAQLENELKILRLQGKETLAKLGVDTDDVMGGLVKLAAEADGVSVEAYIKQKMQANTTAEARQLLQRTEFEKKASADLAALKAIFPETQKYSHIRDIPNVKRFGELRDLGLSAKEAYSAANPDAIRTSVASAVKMQSVQDTKKHLRSVVPKNSKDNSVKMPKEQLKNWRENLFPELSDKEIIALYSKTANKE